MGRKSSINIGDKIGPFTVLDIISASAGTHSKGKVLCSYCGNEKIMSSTNIRRRKSCGCQQNNSNLWKKSGGPKNMPWQLEKGVAAKNNLFYQYKKSASRRKYIFELTESEFSEIVTKPCHYCGEAFTSIKKGQGKTSGDFYYTGIDRKNNSIGYTIENCVPCCKICNVMKYTLSEQEFLNHIKKIICHTGKSNLKGMPNNTYCIECQDAHSIIIE